MNARIARALIRLYPEAWRQRYGCEFAALLESCPLPWTTMVDVIWAALQERLSPAISRRGKMMLRFHALCTRAPWAMFTLGPLLLLAAAYFVAGFLLWSGWQLFLPHSSTPFVPIRGFAILYFGIGRGLYYAAPFLVGWLVVLAATRAGVRSGWPIASLLLTAFIGTTIQVHVSRPSAAHVGEVSMGLSLGDSLSANLIYASVVLLMTAMPYLLLQWQKKHSRS